MTTPTDDERRRALHMEEDDSDRRQEFPDNPDYIPGEEIGDAGEETRGGPRKHQGVGPGDPHTDRPKGR